MVGTSPLLVDIAQYVISTSGDWFWRWWDSLAIRMAARWIFPAASYWGLYRSFPKSAGRKPSFNRVVVGMFERRNRMPMDELLELRFAGNIIEEAANVYERVCG